MKFFKFLLSVVKWGVWFGVSLFIASSILYFLNDGDINMTNLVALWIVVFLPPVVIKIRKIKKQIVR
ncbi:MAG: hypothetical protein ACD_19C00140G0008 [uncultured bacterium]|nr:MAG: hypothetical protein ACD_19C00140G0008 [uncultured bacterium]